MCNPQVQITPNSLITNSCSGDAYTGRSTDVVSMLDQRRRRWPNIETTLDERLVIAGHSLLTHHVCTFKSLHCIIFFVRLQTFF